MAVVLLCMSLESMSVESKQSLHKVRASSPLLIPCNGHRSHHSRLPAPQTAAVKCFSCPKHSSKICEH